MRRSNGAATAVLLTCAMGSTACQKAATTEAPAPAASVTAAAPPPAPPEPPAPPPKVTGPYPPLRMQISSGCTEPVVLLSNGTKPSPNDKPNPNPPWPWPREIFLAHTQFTVVTSEAALAGTPHAVQFYEAMFKDYPSIAVRCSDAATCNEAGATFKGVVRGSTPQAGCGFKSVGLTAPKPTTLVLTLPSATDVQARCARMASCLVSEDHGTPGEPATDCLRAPHKQKLECTSRATCAEVVACAAK